MWAGVVQTIQLALVGSHAWLVTPAAPQWNRLYAYVRTSPPWVVLVTYALAFWPAGAMVAGLTQKWMDEIQNEAQAQGMPDGGLWIGRLERVLIVSFVLADRPDAIGALAVAKGFIRFAEIKESSHRKVAEYILIGSMSSFSIALVLGWLARLLLRP